MGFQGLGKLAEETQEQIKKQLETLSSADTNRLAIQTLIFNDGAGTARLVVTKDGGKVKLTFDDRVAPNVVDRWNKL